MSSCSWSGRLAICCVYVEGSWCLGGILSSDVLVMKYKKCEWELDKKMRMMIYSVNVLFMNCFVQTTRTRKKKMEDDQIIINFEENNQRLNK